jgi:crossover junction endodeoxyribonuclease RusA
VETVIKLELPWPPSLNHYYRHVGPRVLISKAGRAYRDAVIAKMRAENVQKMRGDVELVIDAYPPDNRRRDADNIEKCLWDSLIHGGLAEDDSKFKRHTTTMREPIPEIGGMVFVEAKPYKPEKNR